VPALTNAPVGVTNGLFTVVLNFGTGGLHRQFARAEIAVRGYGDTNAYTALSPWQTLTPCRMRFRRSTLQTPGCIDTRHCRQPNLAGTVPTRCFAECAILTNNVIFSGQRDRHQFHRHGYGLSNVPGTSLVGNITAMVRA